MARLRNPIPKTALGFRCKLYFLLNFNRSRMKHATYRFTASSGLDRPLQTWEYL